MENQYEGEKFLNRLYKDIHMSSEVMHTAISSDSEEEKIHKYLERLEKVENMARDSKYNGMKHLKNLYSRLCNAIHHSNNLILWYKTF